MSAGTGEAHNDMRNNHGTSHQSGGRHTEARTFDTIHRARLQAGGWEGGEGLVMATEGEVAEAREGSRVSASRRC